MKKTLIIALAGMMLFAFTQCGGGGSSKGSKEFQDNKKAINEMTKILKNAKTCEDLDKLYDIEDEMDKKEYDEKEKMTDVERSEMLTLAGDLFELLGEKNKELCD